MEYAENKKTVSRNQDFDLFKQKHEYLIPAAKALKLAILLDGSESRLLTAQESAAAKPLLLFQSKSHDWMDST